jgi:hypothetical protein
MRKILLGTTAVVGAALLGNVAQAQTAPTVRVGGYFEFTAGHASDSADRNAVAVPAVGTTPARTVNRDKVDFRADMEISVIVRGKAANGLSYGAEIELQMDANNTSATAVDTDEMWGFISSPTFGTFQFGDNDSAADQLKISAPGVTNLGESGGWDEFIAPAADGTRYILSTINDGSDATKIIYMSPQFFGFDFGVSYAPNALEGENFLVGGSSTNLQRDPTQGTIRNEIAGALRYRGSFGNVGVAAAISAMRGDAPESNGVVFNGATVGLQDLSAYQAGLTVTAFGLTVGGHYVWGNYAGASFGRTAIRDGLSGSKNYTLGATYVTGALSFGGFYSNGTRDNGANLADREQTAYGIGAVYTLAPGMDVFANYTSITDRNIANSAQNPTALAAAGNGPGGRNRDIDVVIIGTRLTF